MAFRRPNPSTGCSAAPAGPFVTLTRVAAVLSDMSLEFLSGTGRCNQEAKNTLAPTHTSRRLLGGSASFLSCITGVRF